MCFQTFIWESNDNAATIVERNNQKNVNSKKLAEALPICLNLHDDPKSINSAVRLSKHTYILFIF